MTVVDDPAKYRSPKAGPADLSKHEAHDGQGRGLCPCRKVHEAGMDVNLRNKKPAPEHPGTG